MSSTRFIQHKHSNRLIKKLVSVLLISQIFFSQAAFANSTNMASTPITLTGELPILDNSQNNTKNALRNALKNPNLLAQNPVTAHSTAQSINKASISGKIVDPYTNEAIIDARIVLTKQGEEHTRFQTESKSGGTYSFSNIEPGDYVITASAENKLADNRPIKLIAGQNEQIDFKLEDIEGVDILRVTGKRTLIHPQNIGSETNLDHDLINHYKSGNDLRELIESTPGVMPDSYGNIIVRGEHNSVNYMLDGVILPEATGVLQQSQFVSPRSLQSMKVDIGGYQAEDGGGPLGAVVHMKSLPITPKPYFTFGQQLGYPMAGNFWYNGSTAFSQNPDSKLYKLRVESSGAVRGTALGSSPPVKDYVHNGRADINLLTKLEYLLTDRDTLNATLGINHTFLQVPISRISQAAGVNENQSDAQDYLVLNYKHKFARFFDEANLHIVNGFYWEKFHSNNVFDPDPVINGGQPIQSIAPHASRFSYSFSPQGDISKVVFKTHFFKAGFFGEYRPTNTDFGATYYNNDTTNGVPVGAIISPFNSLPGGPQFTSQLGRFHSSRALESVYFQDSWRPQKGWLRRLTMDAGIRVDAYQGYFGNTLGVANVLATVPGVMPFNIQPFLAQRVSEAQPCGRFGGSFVLTKTTVLRGSYSDLFMPPTVDIFSTPPSITQGLIFGSYNGLINGVYNGTVRPMKATRGRLVDVSLEHQIGPRFVTRTNLFFKMLENYGDSGVIGNSLLYNRQTVSNQNAYGVETRMDLKPGKDGNGFYGYLSNTVAVAYLHGTKQVTGGIYDIQTTPIEDKFPDHDRRFSLNTGLGYKVKNNWWILYDLQVMTGLQNELPVGIIVGNTYYGPHPARTPVLTVMNLSMGYQVPKKLKKKFAFLPNSFDLRIQNLLNLREATNLGSPFQGTRYLLPFNFLIGCSWTLGKDPLPQLASSAKG